MQEHTQGRIICKRPMIFPRIREYPELEGTQEDDEAQLLQKGLLCFRAADPREGSFLEHFSALCGHILLCYS